MQVHIYKNELTAGKAAAMLFAAKIIEKPSCVLGMATGSTPLPMYNYLVELYNEGLLDFSAVRTFNLDEYIGLDKTHPQSYYAFMFDNFFSKVNIKPENVKIPSVNSSDPIKDCALYDKAIEAAGGIDLQVLGVGVNGHIAFNEPAGEFIYGTHIASLTESTIESNKRFFKNAQEVPKKAVTMGVGSIMKARELVFIATGAAKAEAVKSMIKGEVSPKCSASILQLHPKATIFLDESAAKLL
ncbi:MAG: glucosamine-6-phosphate deaminase [Elusimicrobia bacterium]|nr:glucosamine-6-phosphate deaminase [Elusimicrobiota bacterium]